MHLLVGDVVDDDDSLVVSIRSEKNSHAIRDVAIPYGTNREMCPVRSWRRWRDAARLTPGEAAFMRIDRWGRLDRVAMTGEAVGDLVTRRANLASADGIRGHSLRRGLATEARRAGRDRTAIARQGGWSEKSGSLDAYLETVDRWTDNATAGLL
ncbi:hypothetical protein [Phytomonospora endophytica]|uniref:Integrase n=1 Tax=Phytomonospora endophytica TaxID=714109 RepID=A0A841G0V2_9ACTN|nr:integrase [Phytomonospora endophytica]GIG70522.1 hypothetical protein Pen01_68170 [Phytomonospora endophytica]